MDTLISILLAVLAFIAALVAAFWLTLIIWTFRDMRSRSRDIFAQILAAMVVAVLNFPGVLIYILLRPKETLAEAYERSLEEEALLQGIEEALNCPGCGNRVREDWLVCPNCHTKLKKSCTNCGQALNLRWNVCPYCGTPAVAGVQLQSQPTEAVPAIKRSARRSEEVAAPEAPPIEPAAQ